MAERNGGQREAQVSVVVELWLRRELSAGAK